MKKLSGVKSNWEFVVWYLINECTSERDRSFSRSEILKKNYDEVYDILVLLGHKKRPQHMEETIQKTLQNMRDKNWIIFLGQGDYKLTSEGDSELQRQKENIKRISKWSPEERKVLRQLAREV